MLSPSNFIRWKKPKPPLDPARAQTSILSNSSVTSRRFTASQSQKTERPAHYGVSNLDVAPAVPSPEQSWCVKYKQDALWPPQPLPPPPINARDGLESKIQPI